MISNDEYWISHKDGMLKLTLGSIYMIVNAHNNDEFHYYIFKGNSSYSEISSEIFRNAIFLGRNKLLTSYMEFLHNGQRIGFYEKSGLRFVKIG